MNDPDIVFGKFQTKWKCLELSPVLVRQAVQKLLMSWAETGPPLTLESGLVSVDQAMFMITSDARSAQFPRDPEYPWSIRSARHEVSNEDHLIIRTGTKVVEEGAQLVGAAVDITYPDRSAHPRNVLQGRN